VLQAASAIGSFIMRQHMTSIPNDRFDAARIDGASEIRIFGEMGTPLSRLALVALAIFTFTYQWDDVFWSLTIVVSEAFRMLPLSLALFVTKNRTVWDLLMASSVITTVPVLIVYLMFQRDFIVGITATDVK
jgi:multiple sugar transport system permease protein